MAGWCTEEGKLCGREVSRREGSRKKGEGREVGALKGGVWGGRERGRKEPLLYTYWPLG